MTGIVELIDAVMINLQSWDEQDADAAERIVYDLERLQQLCKEPCPLDDLLPDDDLDRWNQLLQHIRRMTSHILRNHEDERMLGLQVRLAVVGAALWRIPRRARHTAS